MKIFIWNYISELTDSFHSSGGLVVIAETLERAISKAKECNVKFEETELTPTKSFNCDAVEEDIFIYPDAGCC